jgi:hypothetical protein
MFSIRNGRPRDRFILNPEEPYVTLIHFPAEYLRKTSLGC